MGYLVEVISRNGAVLERHRIEHGRVTIGRGYDNDIILADPYVDARHLAVSEGASGFEIEVLTDTAHTLVDRAKVEEHRVTRPSGAHVVLGRTHLRLLAANHAVAPVLTFQALDRLITVLSRPAVFAGCLVAYLVFAFANLWLESYREMEFADVLLQLTSPLGAAVVWAALWGLVTRLARGETRFLAHLLVTLAYLVFSVLVDWLVDLVAFNTGSEVARQALELVGFGVSLALLLVLHLRFAFRQTRSMRHGLAHVMAWGVVGYSALTTLSFTQDFQPYPSFDNTLLPQGALLISPTPQSAFLDATEALFVFPEPATDTNSGSALQGETK